MGAPGSSGSNALALALDAAPVAGRHSVRVAEQLAALDLAGTFAEPGSLAATHGLRVAAGVRVERACPCAGTRHHECALDESATRHRAAGTWALSPELARAKQLVEELYASGANGPAAAASAGAVSGA